VELAAGVDVLGALDAVHVAGGEVAVLEVLVAHPGVGQGAVARQLRRGIEPLRRSEAVALHGEAREPAVGVAVGEARRQAGVEAEHVLPVLEALEDMAVVVQGIDPVVERRRYP
jgi:hypothetical protein